METTYFFPFCICLALALQILISFCCKKRYGYFKVKTVTLSPFLAKKMAPWPKDQKKNYAQLPSRPKGRKRLKEKLHPTTIPTERPKRRANFWLEEKDMILMVFGCSIGRVVGHSFFQPFGAFFWYRG